MYPATDDDRLPTARQDNTAQQAPLDGRGTFNEKAERRLTLLKLDWYPVAVERRKYGFDP